MENELTAAQVRAARALLAWSQQDLAKHANVAVSTIADFERGQRTPVANNAQAIRQALESGGITFLTGGAVSGGTPMPDLQPQKTGLPISWINATDLAHWADRRDSQGKLPQLITRLIRMSIGFNARLNFPSEDEIQNSGWDGACETEMQHAYVPTGSSGWELSTQRNGIAGKATDDYDKRTKETPAEDRAKTTFIFVTPRAWTKKKAWVDAKRAEGEWKDVAAYTATDLLHWIEAYPAVGLWLANIVGKRPPGILPLQEAWEEWSLATLPPLTTDVTLAGRDQQAARVLKWLRGSPSVLSVQGHSVEEAVAFLYASIAELPPRHRAAYESMTVVANSADAARQLGDSLTPLIIVLDDAHIGLANKLVAKGHYVFLACSPNDDPRDGVMVLPSTNRFAVEDALKAMNVENAERIAHDSAGSIAILRRLLPAASVVALPSWASAPTQSLIGAMLTGAWDDRYAEDRRLLEALTQQSYEQIVKDLTPLIGNLDSPVTKVGHTWKITSPRDAWMLLKKNLTDADFERFCSKATEALSAKSETLPSEEDTLVLTSNMEGYSKILCDAICETMVLFALYGNDIPSVRAAGIRIANLIAKLLEDASAAQWVSVHRQLQLLSEAAPEAFLQALEDDLQETHPNLMVLFEAKDSGLFPTEKISTLLWALESLAWSKKYLPDASLVLAKLAAIDPGGKLQNRPENSLRQIFLLWHPQTYASMNERFIVIDKLMRHVPEVAWKLMLAIVPRDHDSASNSPLPRWRDYSEKSQETITYGLIWKGAEILISKLLDSVGNDVNRWRGLIDVFYQFPPAQRAQAIEALAMVAPQIAASDAEHIIWNKLRHLIHRHREHPDAGWSIEAEELKKLEAIYQALTPKSDLKQFYWLFGSNPELLDPTPFDGDNNGEKPYSWDIDAKRLQQLRCEAIKTVMEEGGALALREIIASVERPFFVGISLAETEGYENEKMAAVTTALKSEERTLHDFAQGFIQMSQPAVAAELLAKSKDEHWANEAVVRIFTALPTTIDTWQQVDSYSSDVAALYWQRVSMQWVQDNTNFALERLIAAGRARHAIHLAGLKQMKNVPSNLLVSLLQNAAEKGDDLDDGRMDKYYVIQVFKKLDTASDIAPEEIAKLEWLYLPIFRFSEREPVFLEKFLAQNPEFFVEALSALYKKASGEESQDDQSNREELHGQATRAFHLFHMWSHIPGMDDNGNIDAGTLNEWIRKTRQLSKEADRLDVADLQIGGVFSASPVDKDGLWPLEAIRNVIEDVRSKHIERGFTTGLRNRRGVTSRGMLDGGQQERELAKKYRTLAQGVEFKWPRTASMLESLARGYEEEARWYDEDAARNTW